METSNEKILVYIVKDTILIEAYKNDSIEEFAEAIAACPYVDYYWEEFDTADEARAFIDGVFFDKCHDYWDDDKFVLQSWVDEDKPYIEQIQTI